MRGYPSSEARTARALLPRNRGAGELRGVPLLPPRVDATRRFVMTLLIARKGGRKARKPQDNASSEPVSSCTSSPRAPSIEPVPRGLPFPV